MTYEEKLKLPQWQAKRKEILERDNYTCQRTGCLKTYPEHLGEFLYSQELSKFMTNTDEIEWNLKSKVSVETKFLVLECKIANIPNETFTDYIPVISPFPKDIEISDIFIYYIKPKPDSKNTVKIGLKAHSVIYAGYKGLVPLFNVHHKRYIKNKMPWEYPNSDLIALCNVCHQELHKSESIPVYNTQGQRIDNAEICDRCNGSGYLDQYSYVQGGVCFKCMGEGVDLSNL